MCQTARTPHRDPDLLGGVQRGGLGGRANEGGSGRSGGMENLGWNVK